MTRPVIVFHGNCVVSAIFEVLSRLPGASEAFEFAAFAFGLPVAPDDVLARASLLVTQNCLFGKTLPIPQLTQKLPPDVTTLRIPNVMLTSLWPLACTDPRDAPDAEHPFGRHSRSQTDRLALDIMRRVPDPAARLAAYFAVDVQSVIDLGRLHEIQSEQLAQNEQDCDIQVAAHVLTTFHRQRLFFAHHHPTPDLLLYLIAQILTHPKYAAFRSGTVASLLATAKALLAQHRPFQGEEVPIHPEVARYFALEWWTPGMIYRLDRQDFIFEQWLSAYMTEPLP